jgi:putative N6-adenine-specific DNA methylase
MEYNLIATATFGIEAVVAQELRNLGYENLKIENGRVEFKGTEEDIVKCNLWLRCADRVLIKINEFKAESFEELFQGSMAFKWGGFIPMNGKMHVNGKSVKSKLHSVPDCQAIVKKAIVESMKKTYKTDWFEENGPVYKIEVGILKDIVTLTIDTSGPGLHKRGYRELAGEAPLKETLAAAMVLLSKWEPHRVFADPLCGSGTIAIEAALIGKNIAPGLNRSYTAETWSNIPSKLWEEGRTAARAAINDLDFRILASDINSRILVTARENAIKAGVEKYIAFQKLDVLEFSSKKRYGCIISNPPYGERIGELKEVEKLYKNMGQVFSELEDWSFFIITSHLDFQRVFGKRATKNRKLYNGRIQCYFYEFFGPLPKRRDMNSEDVSEATETNSI